MQMNDPRLADRVRLLGAMGLEFWVRRSLLPTPPSARPAGAAPQRPARSGPAAAAAVLGGAKARQPVSPVEAGADVAAAAAAERAAAAPFELRAANLPGVVLLTVPGAPAGARLALDVLRAAAGVGSGKPERSRLNWPPRGAAAGDDEAARRACGAFVRGRIDQAGAQLLIVLGPQAAARILDAPLPDDPVAVLAFAGLPCVLGPAPDELLYAPELKKALWQSLVRTLRR